MVSRGHGFDSLAAPPLGSRLSVSGFHLLLAASCLLPPASYSPLPALCLLPPRTHGAPRARKGRIIKSTCSKTSRITMSDRKVTEVAASPITNGKRVTEPRGPRTDVKRRDLHPHRKDGRVPSDIRPSLTPAHLKAGVGHTISAQSRHNEAGAPGTDWGRNFRLVSPHLPWHKAMVPDLSATYPTTEETRFNPPVCGRASIATPWVRQAGIGVRLVVHRRPVDRGERRL